MNEEFEKWMIEQWQNNADISPLAAWQASRKQALEEAATKAETEICECCWPDGVREAAEEIAFQIRGLQKE